MRKVLAHGIKMPKMNKPRETFFVNLFRFESLNYTFAQKYVKSNLVNFK